MPSDPVACLLNALRPRSRPLRGPMTLLPSMERRTGQKRGCAHSLVVTIPRNLMGDGGFSPSGNSAGNRTCRQGFSRTQIPPGPRADGRLLWSFLVPIFLFWERRSEFDPFFFVFSNCDNINIPFRIIIGRAEPLKSTYISPYSPRPDNLAFRKWPVQGVARFFLLFLTLWVFWSPS